MGLCFNLLYLQAFDSFLIKCKMEEKVLPAKFKNFNKHIVRGFTICLLKKKIGVELIVRMAS